MSPATTVWLSHHNRTQVFLIVSFRLDSAFSTALYSSMWIQFSCSSGVNWPRRFWFSMLLVCMFVRLLILFS